MFWLAMDTRSLKSTFLSLMLTLVITLTTAAFNDYHSDKVLLSDVKALTLHQGQMTNARRSPPVPQLKCVGGSAQYKFTPKVVQCINRGSDGYDIQWECKTDMDNAYRFGHVEVTCEGYDYPNDPYVLKGSCGLEYTIELTEEGTQRERHSGGSSYYSSYPHKESTGGVSGLFVFAAVLFAMYVIYKTCLVPAASAQMGPTAPPEPSAPPPYGFRPEFTSHQDAPPPYDSFGTQSSTFGNPSYSSAQDTSGSAGGGGGFWTGAATGGLLGYLFGRGNNYNNYGYGYNRGYGGGGWFNTPRHHHHHYYGGDTNHSGSFFSSSSSGNRSSSSGTRTSSGFGGTSRR